MRSLSLATSPRGQSQSFTLDIYDRYGQVVYHGIDLYGAGQELR